MHDLLRISLCKQIWHILTGQNLDQGSGDEAIHSMKTQQALNFKPGELFLCARTGLDKNSSSTRKSYFYFAFVFVHNIFLLISTKTSCGWHFRFGSPVTDFEAELFM